MCFHKPAVLILSICGLTLTACTKTTYYANTQAHPIQIPIYYKVQSGDSLSKIGQKYGLDYISIAQLNHIPAPYNNIQVGQRLRLQGATSTQNLKANHYTKGITSHHQESISNKAWFKPTQKNYLASADHDNTLYYFGHRGSPIYAAQDGIVVYSAPISYYGDLAKFGNLIMIQHNNGYVSVYAHNDKLLVKNGNKVKAGQKIATMGTSGLNHTRQATLAFQLRQSGHVIDARQLIPN